MTPVYTFNDSDAKEPQEQIKPGWYNVEIGQVDGKVTAKGHPMLTLHFIIVDGEHADREVKYADNVMLDGPGAGMGKKKLKAFGIDVAAGDPVDSDALLRRRAQAFLYYEEYKGRENLRVKLNAGSCGYNPIATDSDMSDIPF